MFRKYIDMIINSTDNQKMRELENVLTDTISYIKDTDEDIYNKIECDLYEIAEGKILTEEKAKQWVANMRPKAKWNLNDVQNALRIANSNLPIIPAYVIMNMLYSDLGDVIGEEDTEEVIRKYVKAAEDWYYDEDAAKTENEKFYCYWKEIIN